MERTSNEVRSHADIRAAPQTSLHELEQIEQMKQPQTKAAEPHQDHNPEDNQNLTTVPVKSRKKCMIITFSIIGLLGVLALTLGLVYQFHYKPTVTAGDRSVINLGPNNNVAIQGIKYVDRNFGKDDIIFDVYGISVCNCKKGRFLQEENTSVDYYINHNNGIITKIAADGQLAFFVDTDQFISTILQEEPEEQPARRLQSELQTDLLSTNQAIQDEYLSLLNSTFSDLTDQQLKFTNQPYITFILNTQTNQMEIETPSNQTSRRLLFKFRGAIKKIADRTVKPAVEAVRKNGPAIGAAVGTVAGGAIGAAAGGPMGAIAGAQAGRQIGERVGTIAQGVVQACVPQNTLKIRCNGKQLVNQAMTIGTDMARDAAVNAVSQYTAGLPVPSFSRRAIGRFGRRK